MKIIRNGLLPIGRRYAAINLFGVLFVKHHVRVTPRMLNHELIHSAQMRELLYLPFYIIYVSEWLWRLIWSRGDLYRAYLSISFEREAYDNESDLGYLHRRPLFGQWRRHQ